MADSLFSAETLMREQASSRVGPHRQRMHVLFYKAACHKIDSSVSSLRGHCGFGLELGIHFHITVRQGNRWLLIVNSNWTAGSRAMCKGMINTFCFFSFIVCKSGSTKLRRRAWPAPLHYTGPTLVQPGLPELAEQGGSERWAMLALS